MWHLIGVLGSPYVRRVAISFDLLGLSFERQNLSVFRHRDEFAAINPILKAPTLVFPDGTLLIESGLILDYAEAVADPSRSLIPQDLAARRAVYQAIGLALAASEKAVQIVYERTHRPPEKRHAPWVERIEGQLRAALSRLEQAVGPAWLVADRLTQADITTAVVWRFIQSMIPDVIAPNDFPGLAAHCERAEELSVFQRFPAQD